MDLGPLKDKRLQLAAGGGAVLGLVVIIRKKKGGGGETSSTTGSSGGLGTFSDSGMSAYNNLNDELNSRLDGFDTRITGVQDQLGKLTPPDATGSGAGSTSHTPSATPSAHQAHLAHQAHQQHAARQNKTAPKKPAPKKPAPKKPAPKPAPKPRNVSSKTIAARKTKR